MSKGLNGIDLESMGGFVEAVKASYPFYYIRLAGGLLYFGGMVLMAWNVFKTVAAGRAVADPVPAALAHA